jgi:hypothetical protein
MKSEEFDKNFDDGQDVSGFLDLNNAIRPGHASKRLRPQDKGLKTKD